MYRVSIFILKDQIVGDEIYNSPTHNEIKASAQNILPELGSTIATNNLGTTYAADYETDRSSELLSLVSGGRCNVDCQEILAE